ncbi:hypothetical protein AX16_007812 [Volvariella volvacea WC 439]|nr:hypothetical protein AX16_007812 [Volvariella volvacea WC 439]
MSFSAAQAGDDQLTVSQIDQELKCLTERCCHLKYLRNIYTPISHLPPELLLRILTIYKQQVENEHKESQSSSSPYAAWKHTYTWVLVSHVCRHWRNVTLSSPTFWSTIYMPSKLTSLDWVDELLQRSKSATLRVLSLPLSIASGTEGIHLDHLSRFLCHDDTHALRPIRRLQLSLYAQREGDLPDCGGLPLFDSSAHNLGTLEHLEIMYDYSLYYGAQRLLSQLFAGRAPNVRSVCLSKWPWPDYSYQWRVPASPEMTWNEFRRAMTSFEHLQHLDLIGFLSHVKLNTNLGVSGRKEVVPLVLPQLRSLTLRDDWIEQYVEFFEALSIPLTTQVDVRPIMYEEDEVTVELFASPPPDVMFGSSKAMLG